MLDNLTNLSEAEKNQLFDAIPLITILVAGADGNIDSEEMAWAQKVTDIRSYNLKGDLKEYFEKVHVNFVENVNTTLASLPQEVQARNTAISNKLSELNPILAKLDINTGAKFYNSFVTFAEHVAKASGGFLGFMTVNKYEGEVMGLNMLTPIISDEEE